METIYEWKQKKKTPQFTDFLNTTFQIMVRSFGKSSWVARLSNYQLISIFKWNKTVILNITCMSHLENLIIYRWLTSDCITLGWGLRTCITANSQALLNLLVQRPHFGGLWYRENLENRDVEKGVWRSHYCYKK